jgi:hypothetical protein
VDVPGEVRKVKEKGEKRGGGGHQPAADARVWKERTVWLLNSTVLAASTSHPKSCSGKLAALLPEKRSEKRKTGQRELSSVRCCRHVNSPT